MHTDSLEAPKFVGQNLPRIDGHEKVSGAAIYTIDMVLPRMLHGKIKRSSIPHGKILSIDIQRALKVPGVKAVITAQDVPDVRRSLVKDIPIFAIDTVRYVGEPVAAVAAEDIEAAEEAVQLIDVQYEELTAIFDTEESLSPNPGVVIHSDRSRFFDGTYGKHNFQFELDPTRPNVSHIFRAIQGDAQEAMTKANTVIENEFRTTPVHAFHTESIGTLASAQRDGSITLWASHQSPHGLRLEVADALGIPPNKVRIIIPYIGGGFGNKNSSYTDLVAAFLSVKTRRPVRLFFTREEAMVASSVRYPFTIRVKDGVNSDGFIKAREITAIANGGAYGRAGVMNIPLRAIHAAVSTYHIPNIKVEAIGVFTNREPSGAFRGFGAAQSAWAIESQMDIIADQLGLDPIDFRLNHLIEEGNVNALGELMKDKHDAEYLRQAADVVGWENKRIDCGGIWKRGIGFALTNKLSTDPGSTAYVRLRDDGIVEIWSSSTELGQGIQTGFKQIVAEELGVEPVMIKVVKPDTDFTPFDVGTYSSHTLFSVGNALKIACDDLKGKLIKKTSQVLDTREENLMVEGGKVVTNDGSGRQRRFTELFSKGLTRYGAVTETGSDFWGMGTWTVKTSPLDPSTWKIPGGRAGGFYSPGAEAAEVAVNLETGQVKVLKLVVVTNVGKAINPALVEGQIEGSVSMGLTCALSEELCLEAGKIINADLKDYNVLGSIEAIPITFLPHEHSLEDGPYGAKGVGETAIVPVAPAVANAIYNAVGVRLKDLPMTSENVLRELQQKRRDRP